MRHFDCLHRRIKARIRADILAFCGVAFVGPALVDGPTESSVFSYF
jgi:hypothetical protein